MIITLKKGATKKRIKSILEKLAKELKLKGINAYEYCGKITFKNDPLEIQKELRNEWKFTSS